MRKTEQAWSEEEFSGLDLGDERLNRRLKEVAGRLAASPQAPINQAQEDWAATKAAYRLFQNDRVSPSAILKPHEQRTLQRMSGEAVVLAVQDTTFFNYDSHTKTVGLGPIGDSVANSRGLIMHSVHCVAAASGAPLGMLWSKIWARDGYKKLVEKEIRKIPVKDKESGRWIEALRAINALKPQNTKVIAVGDRENDIYDFFHAAASIGANFVVRAAHNRALVGEEKHQYLKNYVTEQRIAGTYPVQVPKKNSRQKRKAHLEVRFAQVTLCRPTNRKSSPGPRPSVFVISAIEVNPPKSEDKVEWLLVTNVPVHNFEDAQERIQWYQHRWQIEVFHKILKSGCKVERCRLQTAKRLARFITLMCVVAWRIFWMTHLKRTSPRASATTILTSNEIKTLVALDSRSRNPAPNQYSVAQAVVAIAKLGGFLARSYDRNPGPEVIWRGWTSLQDAAALGTIFFDS